MTFNVETAGIVTSEGINVLKGIATGRDRFLTSSLILTVHLGMIRIGVKGFETLSSD